VEKERKLQHLGERERVSMLGGEKEGDLAKGKKKELQC